jgi:hemerythrin-like metal-binding protein
MELTARSGELSVGVTILDYDHREMSETIKELQSTVARDGDRSLTSRRLRRLADFTLAHFALEEGMMAVTKYPGRDLHRLHHQRMMQQVKTIAARCKQSSFLLDGSSLSFLQEWHSDHVQNDDLHYGLWLNAIEKR